MRITEKLKIIKSIDNRNVRRKLTAYAFLEKHVQTCGGHIDSDEMNEMRFVEGDTVTAVIRVDPNTGVLTCTASDTAKRRYKISYTGRTHAKVSEFSIHSQRILLCKTSMWCLGVDWNARRSQEATEAGSAEKDATEARDQ